MRQIMSNFYSPWLNTYTQTSLTQYLLNYMLFPQFYPPIALNDFSFMENQFFQNQMNPKELSNHSEKIITEEKKSDSIQPSPQQCSNPQLPSEENKEQLDDSKTRQKYGRNITSNIFRSLLKRLSNPSRFKKLFHQIVQHKKLKITYESFLDQIDILSCKLKSYVKRNQMRRFFVPQGNQKQREEFCLVFRIMSKVYLKQEHTISIFHSKKINKQSRNLHFVLVREMQSLLK